MAEVQGWFAGRLPDAWFAGPPECTADREEILVRGRPARPPTPAPTPTTTPARWRRGPASTGSARTPASSAWRIADDAETLWGRKVSWGARCDERHRALHDPERPGHDPPAHGRAGRARHPHRRRRGPQPQRGAGVVRAPRRPAPGRLDHRAARRDRQRRAGAGRRARRRRGATTADAGDDAARPTRTDRGPVRPTAVRRWRSRRGGRAASAEPSTSASVGVDPADGRRA